jgi:hypothetical protein
MKSFPKATASASPSLNRRFRTLLREAFIDDVNAAEYLFEPRSQPVRPLVLASHQEGESALAQFARNITEGLCRVRIAHAVNIASRREMHSYTIGTPNSRTQRPQPPA